MMDKKQYADMGKDELQAELKSESDFRLRSIGGRRISYIMAPFYAAFGAYDFFSDDSGQSVKWFIGTAFCLGAAKLFSYWRKSTERKITEIKTTMDTLEAKVKGEQ